MDFAAFELDRTFVIEALDRGEIDYLENLSEAAESDFFRQLIGRDALARLAETYPTPRKKEEVPVWLYSARQISLKLHDAGYPAFPYVLGSGGGPGGGAESRSSRYPGRYVGLRRFEGQEFLMTARPLAIRTSCISSPATTMPGGCITGSIGKCRGCCGR